MRWRPGADKAAGLLPIAVDALFGDQPLDQAEGIATRPPARAARPVSTPMPNARPIKLLPTFTPPLTAAAIARAGAEAELGRFSTTQSMPCFANSSAVDSPA